MFVYEVLIHTPIWVWVLLALLVSRGLASLRPRDIAPSRALIVPVVFLVWGLTGLIGSRGLGLDLALFVVALGAGFVGGGALASLTPTPTWRPETGRMAMPGSPVPLAMILIAFAAKYVGNVALAVEDDPAAHAGIATAMTLLGGGFAGLFWGRTLALFRRALGRAGEGGDYASVARALARREGATS